MLKIVIPSHNRHDTLSTINFIPDSYAKNVYIAVRSGEQYENYKIYEDKYNVIAFDNLTGIHDKRDAIARHFAGQRIWMIDDDCILNTTRYDKEKDRIIINKEMVNEEQFYEFLDFVDNLLYECPYIVVRPAIFPKGKTYWPYRKNSWGFTNAILDLNVLNADMLQYSLLNHSEDLVAFLSTIEAGYDTALLSKWMIKSNKPGAKGGMSDVRTGKMIEHANITINKMFPQHTRLREKAYTLKNANGKVDDHVGIVVRPKVKRKATLEKFL